MKSKSAKQKDVAIVMGSNSDLPTMRAAAEVLKDAGIGFDTKILSAHRTPHEMLAFATGAEKKGYKIIIAGAGGAAHLPGMIASATNLPVIGVPVLIGKMNGLDSLLSIAQMPRGVPVATMAVDNAFNAGLFALRILAIENAKLKTYLLKFSKKQATKVKKANRSL